MKIRLARKLLKNGAPIFLNKWRSTNNFRYNKAKRKCAKWANDNNPYHALWRNENAYKRDESNLR